MHLIFFRYGPRAVMLNYANKNNVLIVTSEGQKKKYESFEQEGYELPEIVFLEDFVLPEAVKFTRKLMRERKIDSITTLSEEDMDWVGLLADHFLNQSQYVSNSLFKDKYYMRSFLMDVVEQPYFRAIKSEEDVITFWEKTGKKRAIIKPRSGAASDKVFKVNKDITPLSDEIFSGNYLIEEYVELSEMLTCDGYSIGSNIKRFFSHRYPHLLLDTLTEPGNGELILRTNDLYTTNLDFLKLVLIECKKVLETFSCNGELTPFHFEWFFSEPDNRLVFCEVGKRFGGASIPFLIEYSFGINILTEYWNILSLDSLETIPDVTEENIILPQNISASLAPYKKNGVVSGVPSTDKFSWTKNTWIFVQEGDTTEAANTIGETLFISEFVSSNEEEYQENVQRLKKLAGEFEYKERDDDKIS